jgi:hypothetical protein
MDLSGPGIDVKLKEKKRKEEVIKKFIVLTTFKRKGQQKFFGQF